MKTCTFINSGKAKDPNPTNRHTPHPGPLPVEGRGKPDDAPRASASRCRIHYAAPANATAGARKISLELDHESTAARSAGRARLSSARRNDRTIRRRAE